MLRELKGKLKKRDGGIEGLPLQLMIMVLVAGLGTTVILGWMGGLEAPKTIDSVHVSPGRVVLGDPDGDGIFSTSDIEVVVTVQDQEGSGIPGATVLLEGSSVKYGGDDEAVHGVTGPDGRVEFTDLNVSSAGEGISYLHITVAKPGYGSESTTSVPVICG
ncbi:MAG: carboxypeptidase-like regulatory domain-containing protein [Methanomassiliicoccales archaeon]